MSEKAIRIAIICLTVFQVLLGGIPIPCFAGSLEDLGAAVKQEQIGDKTVLAAAQSASGYDNRAEAAKKQGINTLVIAFEGLASHSSGYANDLLKYQDKIRSGQKASKPSPVTMNFIGKHLLKPYLDQTKGHAEFITFSEASQKGANSPAVQCAVAWHNSYGPELNLIVVGHSFGGYAAIKLCNELAKKKIPVDHMLTIDARTMPGNYKNFIKPDNVASAQNFFQKSLFMPGYPIEGAVNTRIKGIDHGHMPGGEQVKAAFGKMLSAAGNTPAPPPTATIPPVPPSPPVAPPTTAGTPPVTTGTPPPATDTPGPSGISSIFSGFSSIFLNISGFIGVFLGKLFKF